MQDYLGKEVSLNMRIGIHTGSVVAGVVGTHKLRQVIQARLRSVQAP